MTHLYLIRHGENIDGQVDGKGPTVDLGLSDHGRRQVQLLCTRMRDGHGPAPTVLLSSPERRASETAKALSEALLLPFATDSRLEEWHSDDGSMAQDEFMAQWRALRERDRAYHRFQPQSETQAEFCARVGDALHSIARDHANAAVLLVTHGGFIQAAFRHFFGFGDAAFRRAYPAATHASVTLWREEEGTGRWVLEYANDARHLDAIA